MPHAGKALIDPYAVFSKIKLLPGMRVADLGCGRTGHFVFPAAQVVGERGIVYGVEIVKDILESIKSRVRTEGWMNIQPIWADIEIKGKIPVPAATLDACFMVNVMFMVKDKSGAIHEATRLLRQGGKLVVVDWMKNLGTLGPVPNQMLPMSELEMLAEEAGLKKELSFNLSDYHYCIIFNKS